MKSHKRIYIIPTICLILVIFVGMIILNLPICNKGNVSALDNLFTSTSATCANGMSTVNLSEHYTFFGQIVIAILTEIGAVGFITFISFIFSILKKKRQLSDSMLISSVLSDDNLSRLKTRLNEVIKYTFIIELIGGILLSIKFIPLFGFKCGVWYSLFHSIMAFSNAGFNFFERRINFIFK